LPFELSCGLSSVLPFGRCHMGYHLVLSFRLASRLLALSVGMPFVLSFGVSFELSFGLTSQFSCGRCFHLVLSFRLASRFLSVLPSGLSVSL
jgi:hypothetical protein